MYNNLLLSNDIPWKNSHVATSLTPCSRRLGVGGVALPAVSPLSDWAPLRTSIYGKWGYAGNFGWWIIFFKVLETIPLLHTWPTLAASQKSLGEPTIDELPNLDYITYLNYKGKMGIASLTPSYFLGASDACPSQIIFIVIKLTIFWNHL